MASRARLQQRRRAESDEEEDASQMSQTLDSQSTRSAFVMDPSQNQSDRRKIRRSYRELIQQTTDQKQEYIRPESEGLFKAIERGDELYREVKMPREAALDAEFLHVASQVGLEQTRRLHTGFKTYEVNDFVSRLKTQFSGDINNNNNGSSSSAPQHDSEGFNWSVIGKAATSKFHCTPAANFMFGPMSTEPPQKKQRKKIIREKKGVLIRPEEVENTQIDSAVETTQRVTDVHKNLQKAKAANYFHFVLDPLSFGQTVENIFHTAFLIRDGLAKLSDQQSVPGIVLEPTKPPTEEDYSSGKAQRKQCVLRFDWTMWEKMKALNESNPPLIPHRQPGDYMHPGLKNPQNNQNNNNNNNKNNNNNNDDSDEEEEEQPQKQNGTRGGGKRQANNKNSRRKNKDSEEEESEEEEEEEEEEEDENEKAKPTRHHRATPHTRSNGHNTNNNNYNNNNTTTTTTTTTSSSNNNNSNGNGSPMIGDGDDENYVQDSQASQKPNGKNSKYQNDSKEEESEELVDSRYKRNSRQRV